MIEGYTDEECLKFSLTNQGCPDGCFYLPNGVCVGVDKGAKIESESEESEESEEELGLEEESEVESEESEVESGESEEGSAGVQVPRDLWKSTGGGTFSERVPARPRPPSETALPPYEDKQTNIFIRNKYYFRDPRPDQYDFDPNSNVPQSRGSVRSIGRRNPLPRQRLRQRQQRSRIQRRPDKKLEKPAKKPVKVNPKVQKTPPTFAKTINQLLPILLILSIFLFIVYFYKKRGKY